MARFMGTVQGSRGQASRLGGTDSGMRTTCAGWGGAVAVQAYDKDGEDYVRVSFVPWMGRGDYATIYDGPMNAHGYRAYVKK